MIYHMLLAIFCMLNHQALGYERYLLVPQDVKVILDQHTEELKTIIAACEDHDCQSTPQSAQCFSWLPNYYVKYDAFRRINGAAAIEECIKKYGLNLLKVPQKYVYHISGHGMEKSNHNYLVVAPRITALERKPLNLEQTKQLLIVGKCAQFTDWRGNLLFTEDGTLTFIDTGYVIKKRERDSLLERYLHSIHNLVRDYHMVDEAFKYITDTLSQLQKKESPAALRQINALLRQLPELRASRQNK